MTARKKLADWIDSQGEDHRKLLFAMKVGVSLGTVYNWVNGVVPPSRKNAKRIEKVTDGAVPKGEW